MDIVDLSRKIKVIHISKLKPGYKYVLYGEASLHHTCLNFVRNNNPIFVIGFQKPDHHLGNFGGIHHIVDEIYQRKKSSIIDYCKLLRHYVLDPDALKDSSGHKVIYLVGNSRFEMEVLNRFKRDLIGYLLSYIKTEFYKTMYTPKEDMSIRSDMVLQDNIVRQVIESRLFRDAPPL